MTFLLFSVLLFIISSVAGLVGALTGLGGGALLIPALVLLFKVDMHYAMGASLIAVIATSSGAAASFLSEGFTNIRIGILLETGAILGALAGASLTTYLPVSITAILLGCVLLVSSYLSWRRVEHIELQQTSHPWATRLHLEAEYPSRKGMERYCVQRVPTALSLMTLAGILSGLLGIGSGTIKVLAMDQAMRLPYKVSTATSNFIIGITAVAGVGVYFSHGYINSAIAFPVVLGVLTGAILGSRILASTKTQSLRTLFGIVVLLLAIEMIYKGISGAL